MAKLNTNSNTYIIAYSCVMVVVVAFLLAFVSSSLKPAQDVNVALDKKKQILAALNIRNLSDEQSTQMYEQVVNADAIIDSEGNITAPGEKGGEKTGFRLNSADYKAGKLAIFLCNVEGKKKYVVPVYGMGLWGPIWGYIAVNEDGKTVRAMDVLFPKIGEIIGGSEREESYEKLSQRIEELNIPMKDMWWYLDTRRFGTVPHSGFGLGFERLVLFVTGMTNIRDVIAFPRTPGNCEF